MKISEAELYAIQVRQGDDQLAKVRRDANHAVIVKYLRDCGVSVKDMAKVGGGFPDLVCAFRGVNVFVEIKTPDGKLQANQEKFIAEWSGPVVVARSGNEAMEGIVEAVKNQGALRV